MLRLDTARVASLATQSAAYTKLETLAQHPFVNQPSHGKDFVNLWTAGDNVRDGVYASDITVADSWYYKPCDESEGRLYWESRKGEIFTNGGPDITELLEWTEKPEFQIEFPWDDCGFEPPSYDCNDFPWQEIGSTLIRVNVNNANDTIYEPMFGSCWPEEGY